MSKPITLTFPGVPPIPVTVGTVPYLERALRAYRQTAAPRRNLPGLIAEFLAANPGASTLEIARGICARDTDVRRTLKEDPAFARLTAVDDRRRGTRWRPATDSGETVPEHGTGSPTGSPTT